MKKLLLLPLIALFFACSTEDNVASSECKVTSVQLKTFSFDDLNFQDYSVSYNFDKFFFEYDNQNRIVKVKGGFVKLPPGQSMDLILVNDAFDTIVYEQGKIKAEYSVESPGALPKKEFTLNGDGSLQSVKTTTTAFGNIYVGFFTYEYGENIVVEKRDGILNRTFYFSDGNLIKVQRDYKDQAGEIYRKETRSFLEYDQSKNMLKGKFFINGLFLKSFSKNNYKRIHTENYIKSSSGEFVLSGSLEATLSFGYYPDGNANLFEYDCN